MSTKEKFSNYYGVLIFIILIAFFSISNVKAVWVEPVSTNSIATNTIGLINLDQEIINKIELEADKEAKKIKASALIDAQRITSKSSSAVINKASVIDVIMQNPAIEHNYFGMNTAPDIVGSQLLSSIIGETKLSYVSNFSFQDHLKKITASGNIQTIRSKMFLWNPDFSNIVKESSEKVKRTIESANKEARGILDNAVSQAQVSIKGRLSTVIKELYTVASLTQKESGNQPLLGRVAVVNVVYNRVNSPRFANDAISVICSPGQFAPAKTLSQVKYIAPDTWKALKMHFEGVDTAKGAFYFYNPRYSTAKNKAWFATLKTTVTIGDHVFKK